MKRFWLGSALTPTEQLRNNNLYFENLLPEVYVRASALTSRASVSCGAAEPVPMLAYPGAGSASGREAAAGEPSEPGRTEESFPGLVGRWRTTSSTSAASAAAGATLWFVSSSPLRVYTLLALLLALLVLAVAARDLVRSRCAGARRQTTDSWEMMDSGQLARSGPGLQLGDSLRLLLKEASAFKQQNPGKFCLLICSLCSFFAVVGRYIPGIVLSYLLVLGVFLWPLVSSHEVGLWVRPALLKLDFGIGALYLRVKENREKRLAQTRIDTEGIESDLSSMFPKLDSAVRREMSVSDTEVSDVTWTDNGTFNLSEGHTPQSENSEDLDREEAFTGGLAEFPSLDNGASTNGDDDEFSLGLPQVRTKETQLSVTDGQSAGTTLELVNQLAGDVITAAVTAAMQDHIEAAGLTLGSWDRENQLLELVEDSDSEVEDFELLDQSELEQLDGDVAAVPVKEEAPMEKGTAPPTGFFSKLLRRK
ncbi:reticulophagy regulator 1 isoform X1 [Synchiropus splendidus]|uniref:reticulophagy regulator 1 isoform X1 n=2 Tax=Synchiropus splendidus TaxID=270530 RepID=UPI00237EE75E|nr:reticulophagy regulator 1 isoform X1 [Synchiropus splendidus]